MDEPMESGGAIKPISIRLPKGEKIIPLREPSCDLRAHHALLDTQIGPRSQGVVAIDFDDTLTRSGGISALLDLRAAGWGLVVFSANADITGIKSWLKARWPPDAGPIPPVTNHKPQATWYIDDKAIAFTSWSDVLEVLLESEA